jgi:hypothetical protein
MDLMSSTGAVSRGYDHPQSFAPDAQDANYSCTRR